MTDLLAIHGKVAIISRVPLCGQINTINTLNRKLFPIRLERERAKKLIAAFDRFFLSTKRK